MARQFRMAVVLGALCALLSPLLCRAQFPAPERLSLRSFSGQFVIQSVRGGGTEARISRLQTNQNLITLEQTVLPVASERIKQHLWHLLDATGPWQGKIFVALYPSRTPNDQVFLRAERFRDGWQYRLEMPDLVERTRYVRGMVQVVLLELANRQAREHAAELPAWLIEGLTQQLLAANEREIVLPPPQPSGLHGLDLVPTIVSEQRKNPLEKAHQELSTSTPLTFDQLSWPEPAQLEGPAGEAYRSSAQLFVNELLRLDDGPVSLRRMLEELPGYYNWQFAFLDAFRADFQRPVEVEKWWTLHLMQFTGRSLDDTWLVDESREKLDEVIRSAVQVRASTNDLPGYGEVSLQAIIRQWDPPHQTAALQNKLRELELVRLRITPELVPFVDEYRQVLGMYLKERDRTRVPLLTSKKAAAHRAAEEAVQHLDALDARRRAWQPTAEAGPPNGG